MQGLGFDQGDVAVEDEDIALPPGERRQGAADRVSGPVLLRLQRGLYPRQPRGAGGLADRHGLVPDHHHDLGRRQRCERPQRVVEQGEPGDLVQHLGARRLHAATKTGGENDSTKRARR